MAQICLKVIDKDEKTLAVARGEAEVNLMYAGEYQEGDRILVEVEEKEQFYWLQLDDAKGHSLVYLKKDLSYTIPFSERRINISPKAFAGGRHLLHVRKARDFEHQAYRNLACNVNDQHEDAGCYPHASANVETRNESVFAALNAIDGVTAADCHGEWPYQSWGINRQKDARLCLEFGRKAEVDRIIFYTRADYPHDNWWKQVAVTFSDGSKEEFMLRKTGNAQEFIFEKKTIEWLELGELIQSEEPSPFPALTQIEVYGK